MKQLRDRVAVITGAGGDIGRALALRLGQEGCRLALVDLGEAALRETAAGLGGRPCSLHVVDVANRAQMERLPQEVIDQHGRVHVLVNNAGVSVAGTLEQVSFADLEWIIGVNLWGVLHGCKLFLPLLRAEEEGHIVNVCSSFGLLGFPRKGAYALTKGAVRSLSECLRAELYGSRVGLTQLYPGPVDTGIVRRGRAPDEAQREAEARFLTARAIPAERVAARTVRAILRNEGRVLIGADYRLIDWAARISPGLAAALIARLSRRLPF
jgi:short-subunit dehydrogenase